MTPRPATAATASLALALALVPGLARAGTGDIGDVAVIEDTQNAMIPHCDPGADPNNQPCIPTYFCPVAAQIFYKTHCDDYDALVVWLDYTWSSQGAAMLEDPTGSPVQSHISGIGRATGFDFTSLYGSQGRLQHCVSMQTLATKPDDPDAQVVSVMGLPIPLGLTGVELLGHELGHRWLMGANFDLGVPAPNNLGAETLLRQCETNDSGAPCDPNLHYAFYADSHSVMYGNFLTDNHDGTYTACGGTRKYNELDQYLMGLRTKGQLTNPSDVIWALDDGSHTGDQAGSLQPGACMTTAAGAYTRVDVGIDDIIRALGPRSGPAAESPVGWNVAFVLVEPKGGTPTQATLDKVNAYRTRFETWFTTATDGLGSVHTQLLPNDCTLPPPADGGTPDAGAVDGGAPDSGAPDAGVADAGVSDAGDGGAGAPDANVPDAGARDGGAPATADSGYGVLHAGGCNCDASGTSGFVLPAFALLLLLGLRRRRARQPR